VEASGRIPIYEPPHDLRGQQPEPEEDSRLAKLWLLWRERRLFWNVAWKTALLSAILALLLPVQYEGVV
jgi:uncharacterized protein involved in exopolysaccharide biosynthesis